MELKATPDVIVLKKVEKPTQSEGGIVLPANVSQAPNSDKIGEVYKVGSDVKLVSVGDKVAFSHYNANAVNFGGSIGTLMFVKEENILAVIN